MRSLDAVRRSSASVLAAVLLCAAAPEPTAADALFRAAREARSQSAYPHYATYVTVVRFRSGAHHVTSSWQTIEDVRRRIVHAHSLPVEEAEHPHVPHGINVGVGAGPGGPQMGVPPPVRGHPEPTDDPIGQVTFAVDQDFGLALNAPPIAASRDMSEVASAASTLPRIGRTGTLVRTYEVENLGDVTEDGTVLHHLGLRPLRDPRRNRLRELWTEAKSSLPVRAVVAGVGNRGPLDDATWRVDFVQAQGGTFVARESALTALHAGSDLEDVTITFEQLRLTNHLAPYELVGLSDDVGTTDP
jgi:hypothetical protein